MRREVLLSLSAAALTMIVASGRVHAGDAKVTHEDGYPKVLDDKPVDPNDEIQAYHIDWQYVRIPEDLPFPAEVMRRKMGERNKGGDDPADDGSCEATIDMTVKAANIQTKGHAQSRNHKLAHAHQNGFGSDKVKVSISCAETDLWTCNTDNTITFEAGWDVGPGQRNSVNGIANALDILGQKHRYAAHATASGGQTDEDSHTTSADTGVGVKVSDTQTAGVKGKTPNVSHTVKAQVEAHHDTSVQDEHKVKTTTGAACNGSGGYTVEIHDPKSGMGSASWTYHITADENVSVYAQAATNDLATSDLNPFNVTNGCVYHVAINGNDIPVTVMAMDLSNGWGTGGVTLADLEPLSGKCETLCDSLGLASESGSTTGVARLWLNDYAPRELTFAVACSPSNAIDLLGVDTVTIPEGGSDGHIWFKGLEAGEATIELTLLDENGDPTTTVLTCTTQVTAASAIASPTVLVAPRFASVNGRTVDAPTGSSGTFVVSRLAFAGLATSSTVVNVSVSDPSNVLGSVQSSATIPAGDLSVEVPVPVSGSSGDATVTFSFGAWSEEWTVHAVNPTITAPTGIRVPVGATAYFGIDVGQASMSSRSVSWTSTAAGVATVGGAGADVVPGQTFVDMTATGVTCGSATVQVTSAGFSAVSIPVSVVTPDVAISGGTLTLSGLTTTQTGEIQVILPGTAKFASVTAPAGSSAYLGVEGAGSDTLTLHLSANASVPTELELDVTLTDVSGTFTFTVSDFYHATDTSASYTIAGQQ